VWLKLSRLTSDVAIVMAVTQGCEASRLLDTSKTDQNNNDMTLPNTNLHFRHLTSCCLNSFSLRVLRNKGMSVGDASAVWYLSILGATAQATLPLAPHLRDTLLAVTKLVIKITYRWGLDIKYQCMTNQFYIFQVSLGTHETTFVITDFTWETIFPVSECHGGSRVLLTLCSQVTSNTVHVHVCKRNWNGKTQAPTL
jgi:hypothetical protein